MLDKKKRINYRRRLERMRNKAERIKDAHPPGTAERAYGEGFINGINEAIRGFDTYGKADDEW